MTRDVLELGASLAYLDELSDRFAQAPNAVDPSWHELLAGGRPAAGNGQRVGGNGGNGGATLPALPAFTRPGMVTMGPITAQAIATVWPLVNAYRSRGHFQANLDPLGLLETAR